MNNLTQNQKRNLHVLIITYVLNFSFAAEKFFIIIGYQLSDKVWFCVYRGLGLYLAFAAVHDYIHDIKEGSKQNNNVLI